MKFYFRRGKKCIFPNVRIFVLVGLRPSIRMTHITKPNKIIVKQLVEENRIFPNPENVCKCSVFQHRVRDDVFGVETHSLNTQEGRCLCGHPASRTQRHWLVPPGTSSSPGCV